MSELEMPTPCQKCGEIFDLTDGAPSSRWFPDTVICRPCGNKETDEILTEEEIEDLKNQITDAEITIKDARSRLMELGVDLPFKINTPNF